MCTDAEDVDSDAPELCQNGDNACFKSDEQCDQMTRCKTVNGTFALLVTEAPTPAPTISNTCNRCEDNMLDIHLKRNPSPSMVSDPEYWCPNKHDDHCGEDGGKWVKQKNEKHPLAEDDYPCWTLEEVEASLIPPPFYFLQFYCYSAVDFF